MAEKKQVGTAKFYNVGKGFGFIEGAKSGEDLFFPFKAFADDVTVADIRKMKGAKVEFTTEPGKDGKVFIKNLRPVKAK